MPKQDSPRKRWIFTWFPEDLNEIDPKITQLQILCDKFVAQEEKCPKTDKLHIQGAIWLVTKTRFTALQKVLPTAHWEPMVNEEASIKYCKKNTTACGRRWQTGFPRAIVDPLEHKILYQWQARILDSIKLDADDRTVTWLVDPKGRTGKTALCKHICLTRNAILVGGAGKDIFCGIAATLEQKKEIDIVLINIPRSVEDANRVSYAAIESTKDGIFFSGKYKSDMCLFNSPHVLVFSNFPPILEKLTSDRWRIIYITDEDMAPVIEKEGPSRDSSTAVDSSLVADSVGIDNLEVPRFSLEELLELI